MSDDWEATSNCSLLVHLDAGEDGVYQSGYAPLTEYQANPQEREPTTDFFQEEEGEEEEVEEEGDKVEEGEREEEEDKE